MKIPSYCPFCNDPLLYEPNNFVEAKICNKRVNHNITFLSRANEDCVFAIRIVLDPNVKVVTWRFDTKETKIYKFGTTDCFQLPWFEPNLTNYRKLIKKINTYITFS